MRQPPLGEDIHWCIMASSKITVLPAPVGALETKLSGLRNPKSGCIYSKFLPDNQTFVGFEDVLKHWWLDEVEEIECEGSLKLFGDGPTHGFQPHLTKSRPVFVSLGHFKPTSCAHTKHANVRILFLSDNFCFGRTITPGELFTRCLMIF